MKKEIPCVTMRSDEDEFLVVKLRKADVERLWNYIRELHYAFEHYDPPPTDLSKEMYETQGEQIEKYLVKLVELAKNTSNF